jgi:iron complex outermembrane receptor protein
MQPSIVFRLASLGFFCLISAVSYSQTNDTPTLDEIVVTVERREQNLQDYAGSAQAFDAEDLRRDGIGSEIQNLSYAVPGLSIANQEGNLEIYIRGVGSANNTEIGDPAVAPHINGVYIPRQRGIGLQFYDIERVEVNKGPQGTLRGRNATGGTINIITKKPQLGEVNAYVQSGFGNYDQQTFEAALNLPIGQTTAVRFAGFSEKRETNYDNAGVDSSISPPGIEDEVAGRISLAFVPSDSLNIDAVIDYSKEGGTGYPGGNFFQAYSNGFDFDDVDPRRLVNRAVEGELDSEQRGFYIRTQYDFGPVSLEYTGSRRELDYRQTSSGGTDVLYPGFDVSPAGFNYENYSAVYWAQESDSIVQELRLFSNNDSALLWSVGLFSLDEEQEVGFFSLNDNGLFFSGVEFTMPEVDIESFAYFADATLSLSDQFRVKGGVRATEEDKSRFGIGGNWTLGLGSEGFGCCFTTRFGTAGFRPLFYDRPNFTAPTTPAETAVFFAEGVVFGAQDTLLQQIAGVADGSMPNGTCIDTPDTNASGSQVCPANGQHSFFTLTGPAQQQGSYSDDFVDYRIGAEYDLSPEQLLYVTASTAHKSGGFNDNIADIAPTFKPEELVAYELGSKNQFSWGDNAVTLNGSLFFYDYTDQVFQSLVQIGGLGGGGGMNAGFTLLNSNVADSEILGTEVFGSINFGNGFTLDTTLLWLDSEVKSGQLADVRGQDFGLNPSAINADLQGNDLPNVSNYTIISRLQYAFEGAAGQFALQGLVNYRSSYYLSIFNEDPVVRPTGSTICGGSADPVGCGYANEQDGYFTVNLGLDYTPNEGNWNIQAFINNALDEDASQKALLGNGLNLQFLNNPRQYGVRLQLSI